MLNEIRVLDKELRHAVEDPTARYSTFKPCVELTVDECIDAYTVNQREGKYKALQKFFPAIEHVLGEKDFRRKALTFQTGFPSISYTLSMYHPKFPGWIGKQYEKEIPFLFDLARYEWFWHRTFFQPFKDTGDFDFEKLSKMVASGEAMTTKFRLAQNVTVASFDYNTSTLYRQAMNKEAELRPVAMENYVLFWRPEPMLRRRMPINKMQARMLRMFGRNMTLGQCLRNLQASKDPEALAKFLFEMINEKVIIKVI